MPQNQGPLRHSRVSMGRLWEKGRRVAGGSRHGRWESGRVFASLPLLTCWNRLLLFLLWILGSKLLGGEACKKTGNNLGCPTGEACWPDNATLSPLWWHGHPQPWAVAWLPTSPLWESWWAPPSPLHHSVSQGMARCRAGRIPVSPWWLRVKIILLPVIVCCKFPKSTC